MDITEFRKKYPQYDSIDDKALSDKLYNKYYSGKVDRSEFDAKFLGLPKQSDTLLGDESGDWAITRGAKSMARDAIGAIKGDAALELPNVTQAGMGNSVSVGKASMLGDDTDYAKAVIEQYPDHSIGEDDNGNTVILDPDGEPKAYVNQPGFDPEDIYRIFPKIAAFLPAAKGAQLAGKVGGFFGRVAAGGAGAGVTDAVMQKVAGRDEIDGSQVAVTGALGASAEALAPVIGAIAGKVSSRIDAKRWEKMSKADQNRMILAQMKKDGITPEKMRGVSRDDMVDLARSRMKESNISTVDSTLARNEFGYKVTRGQSMLDDTPAREAAKFDQLSKEELLRSGDGRVGAPFRQAQMQNAEQTSTNVKNIQDGMSGNAMITDQLDGADFIKSQLKSAEQSLKARIDDAYSVARDRKANLYAEAVSDMPERMIRGLDEADVILDDLTPAGTAAMKNMQEFAEKFKTPSVPATNPNALPAPGSTQAVNTIGDVPISEIERQRRRLSRFYDKADNNEDRRAVKIIKDQFDSLLDEAIDTGLFIGDDQALDALKKARSLHADYSNKFRSNDEAGKIIQKMLDIEVDPEQVANYMVGVSGLSKAGAGRLARKYADAVGKDSDGWKALREMTFLRVAQNRTGETKGPQALVSALKQATGGGSGSTLFRELYTEPELAKMKRFAAALDQIVPKGDFARTSGTAERMLRFFNAGGFRSIPGVEMLMNEIERKGAIKAFAVPTREVAPISLMPAGGAYSTSN